MRLLGVFLASIIVCCSWADRLIFIPTGRKVPYRTIRTEILLDSREPSQNVAIMGAGLTKALELELVGDARVLDQGRRGTFNLAYSFLDPVVGFLPGLTLGVMDGADNTPEGRSLYLATTLRLGLEGDYNSDTPAELTLGVGTNRFRGAFVGLMLPFTNRFRILAEHDSQALRVGVEYLVSPELAIRSIHQENAQYWSLSYTRKI